MHLLRWILLVGVLAAFVSASAPAADDTNINDAFKALTARMEDPKADREKLRLSLLAFQRTFPGTDESILVAGF